MNSQLVKNTPKVYISHHRRAALVCPHKRNFCRLLILTTQLICLNGILICFVVLDSRGVVFGLIAIWTRQRRQMEIRWPIYFAVTALQVTRDGNGCVRLSFFRFAVSLDAYEDNEKKMLRTMHDELKM